MPTAHGDGAPRKRTRKALRLLAAIVIAAFVIALAIVLSAPVWLSTTLVRQSLESSASAAMCAPVTIGDLSFGFRDGLLLRNVRIGAANGFVADSFSASTIGLRASLLSLLQKRVIVDRLAITRPMVALEERDGSTNVEAMFVHCGARERPEPEAEPMSKTSLAGWTFRANAFDVQDLQIRVLGGTTNATIAAVGLAASATVADDEVAFGVSIRVLPSNQGKNIAFEQADAQHSTTTRIDGRVTFALDASASWLVDSSAALAFAGGELSVGLLGQKLRIERGTSTVDFDRGEWNASARIQPRCAAVLVDEFRLDLQETARARARLRVEHVPSLLHELMGTDLSVGCPSTTADTGQSRISVSIPVLDADLARVAAQLGGWPLPLSAVGHIAISDLEIQGTTEDLLRLLPEHARGTLRLVGVDFSLPGHFAQVDNLDARIDLGSSTSPTPPPNAFCVTGTVSAQQAVLGPLSIDRPTVAFATDFAASIGDRLASQSATITLGVDALTVRREQGSKLRVSKGLVAANLTGLDPFSPKRDGLEPLRLRLNLTTDRIASSQVGPSLVAQHVALSSAWSAQTLIASGTTPLSSKAELRVGRVDGFALAVQGARVNWDVKMTDPRAGPLTDATGTLTAKADAMAYKAGGAILLGWSSAETNGFVWTVDFALRGLGLSAPRSRAWPFLSMRAETKLSMSKLHLRNDDGSQEETALLFNSRFHAKSDASSLKVDTLSLTLPDVVSLTTQGTVTNVHSAERTWDTTTSIDIVDAKKSFAVFLPAQQREGLDIRGGLGARIVFSGRLPRTVDRQIALETLPFRLNWTTQLRDVTLRPSDNQFSVSNIGGEISGIVEPQRATVAARLQSKDVVGGRANRNGGKEDSWRLRDSAWTLDGGWIRNTWTLKTSLGGMVETAGAENQDKGVRAEVRVDVEHPMHGGLWVHELVASAPDVGIRAALFGQLHRHGLLLWRPDLSLRLDVDAGRLRLGPFRNLVWKDVSGRLGIDLRLAQEDDRLMWVDGALRLEDVSLKSPQVSMLRARGRFPFSQSMWVEGRQPLDADRASRPTLFVDVLDDFADLATGLIGVGDAMFGSARLGLSASDVSITSPRGADYEVLRPFFTDARKARIEIDEIRLGTHALSSVVVDPLYTDGLFRLDRFGFHVFGGDVYGNLAFQIAGEDHLRVRLRSTLTDLNLDVPASLALGRAPSEDEEPYRVSGNIDLKYDFQERALAGYFDLTKMGEAMLVRLLDAIDPTGEDPQLADTRRSLALVTDMGGVMGVRLSGVVVSIKQNLLNLDFVWSRPFFEWKRPWLPLSQLLGLPNIVQNAARPIRRYSLSGYLENPALLGLNDVVFSSLRGRLGQAENGAATAQSAQSSP